MAKAIDDAMFNITNLLSSLHEVQNYIVTDMDGIIHMASWENYTDAEINSCIFLLTIGEKMGDNLNIGAPINVTYYLKSKKTYIFKFEEFVIIIILKEVTKVATLKKKLEQLF